VLHEFTSAIGGRFIVRFTMSGSAIMKAVWTSIIVLSVACVAYCLAGKYAMASCNNPECIKTDGWMYHNQGTTNCYLYDYTVAWNGYSHNALSGDPVYIDNIPWKRYEFCHPNCEDVWGGSPIFWTNGWSMATMVGMQTSTGSEDHETDCVYD